MSAIDLMTFGKILMPGNDLIDTTERFIVLADNGFHSRYSKLSDACEAIVALRDCSWFKIVDIIDGKIIDK